MSPFGILFYEQIAAFPRFQKAQVKRELCAGAGSLELVEQFLIIDRL